MRRLEAITWIMTVCTDLRLSQTKTLAQLVAATLGVGRISLAAIGRQLTGKTSAKHKIKRTWRFTSNRRVIVSEAMRGVIARLCKRRKKPLLVALDWTDIRSFQTLMAAAVLKGRAVPLLWSSYAKWELFKSRNALEEGLLHLLRTLIPECVPVILLADRGFGRVEMARACHSFGFRYLIRIKPDAWIEHPTFRGKLKSYPVTKGMRRVLKATRHRKSRPVTHNIVVRWQPGLPAKRDEPWYLMTDLQGSALQLTALYGKRMTVEELFRDGKSRRNGFALRLVQIKEPRRLDRLLLIMALAYLLLLGLGLVARQSYPPGFWCSSNKVKQCSVFTIGRAVLDRLRVTVAAAIAAVRQAMEREAPNWG
jgi:Transposase DDE domain